MVELLLVNTKPEYGEQYWVDHMLDQLEGKLRYYKYHVITEAEYGGPYDKLRLFKEFKDPETKYIYLDLDMVVRSNIDSLVRSEFTLLDAWWRPEFHTPLNSSVMSWSGDYSRIHDNFVDDLDYHMLKYHKGIDEYIYKEVGYQTYPRVCDSYNWTMSNLFPITLYNQAKDVLREDILRTYRQ